MSTATPTIPSEVTLTAAVIATLFAVSVLWGVPLYIPTATSLLIIGWLGAVLWLVVA